MGYIGKVPADVLIDPHVDSAAITDGTIITADIANDAVTSAKLAQNSVDSSELIDGSVDNSHLAGSIAVNKTLLAGGTGLTLSTNTLNVDASQTQITSVGTLTSLTVGGGSAHASANDLIVGGTSSGNSHGITIASHNDDSGRLLFSDNSNLLEGQIIYDHSNNSMTLGTSATTAITIDSSQDILFAGKLSMGDAGLTSADEFPVNIDINSSTTQQIGLEIRQHTSSNDN